MRRAAVAVTLVATLFLAACTTDALPATQWNPPASGSPGQRAGTINWKSCQSEALKISPSFPKSMTATCGSVTVPADWSKAKDGKATDGKTLDIQMVRIHLNSQTDPIGTVLMNPGGPGGSGFDFAVRIASQMTALMARFDIIGFDPRGVGRSNPVDCMSDADLDTYYGYEPDPVSDPDFQALVTLDKKLGDACGAKYGADLKLFSTEQAARDIDAIRTGLGEDKINYLGFSYGTLLGATYAQLFPTKFRAMVLDGAVDPTATPTAASEGQAMGFERAFTDFSTWCKAHASQCPIANDPRGQVVNALAKAQTAPVTGSDGRKATSGWVFLAVVSSLYDQEAWPYMAQAIANLARGDTRYLFLLADSYADRDANGHYSNTTDAFNAVSCTDGAFPGVAEIRGLQSQWRTKYPLFGASLATGLLNCAEWPAAKDPFPTGKASGAPPIVVVGTTGDPATPYESTAKLATMLGVGHVVTWQGEGHTAYLSTQCVRDAVNRYFIDLTVPQEGFTCPPN